MTSLYESMVKMRQFLLVSALRWSGTSTTFICRDCKLMMLPKNMSSSLYGSSVRLFENILLFLYRDYVFDCGNYFIIILFVIVD